MSTKYFNKLKFEQALALSERNPLLAKELYEDYLTTYPKDYYAYTYYASTLTTLGRYEEAEKVLEQLEIYYKRNSAFTKSKYRVVKLKESLIYTKIKLLIHQEKYEELQEFYMKHYQEIKKSDINVNAIEFYCRKKLGKLTSIERSPNSYLFRQIIEYKEEDFLEHIQKHLAEYNADVESPNATIFAPDFPLSQILGEIKKYIPSDKKIRPGFLEDVYTFKYDECGRCDHKLVDYFKVICFHNTTDIITICPTSDGKDLPYVDLNYLKQKEEIPKVKRLSQIEKFNKKYKIKQ